MTEYIPERIRICLQNYAWEQQRDRGTDRQLPAVRRAVSWPPPPGPAGTGPPALPGTEELPDSLASRI